MRHAPYIAGLAAAFIAALVAAPASASLKTTDSFRIGNAGVLCTAQSRVAEPALTGMFDRGYRIVCRDASEPVGRLLALRVAPDMAGAAARLQSLAPGRAEITCAAPGPVDIADLAGAQLALCQRGDLGWSVYSLARGKTLYVAEGFTGYASALRLGLRTLVADAAIAGEVDVAATEAGDPAAFARVQAGSLDPDQALAEGYFRNNSGSYAEAAAFFELLVDRSRQRAPGFNRTAEYLSNEALQQSNLGNFAEAEALFDRSERVLDRSDAVLLRIDRNFRAMHALNRRQPAAAQAALQRVPTGDFAGFERQRLAVGYIDVPIAQKLNGDDARLATLARADTSLTPAERAAILDAQARFLEGAAARMAGQDAAALEAFDDAANRLAQVRGGRVAGSAWLAAGVATERAIIEERRGQQAAARQSLLAANKIFEANYRGSAALLVSRAQLAAFLQRTGATDEALALYRDIIKATPTTPGGGQAVRTLVGPYLAILADRGSAGAADFFDASQVMVRPGVAQTQAVLARELGGGSDAASTLFRQSVSLSRDIVRTEAEIAAIAARTAPEPADATATELLRARREVLGREQTAVLAKLADYPRYRSIRTDVVTLADLQARLRAGEAYYKLVLVGDEAYALFVTAADARSFRVASTTAEIGSNVAALRDTIVKYENGRPVSYPFDASRARRLYRALFDPVEPSMAAVEHLIVEPDGAMLQLPFNLLITADDGLADYERRQDSTDPDAPFNMTGIAWLGRTRMVTTAVSPRAFLDVRALAASPARRSYLGLGENAVPRQDPRLVRLASASNATPIPGRDPCDWRLAEWRNPISASELRIGAGQIGRGTSLLLTGAAFTDTALLARTDLRDFRIIHFATHGLVTAPRPECPARPALLTSFGDSGSDGLLTFREIFDLELDADTIILSACDTAGAATAAATRDAGVATGGNFALDGLVRAFVGAGARAVIASHWPVPDDFGATRTLVTGLFTSGGAISVGDALRRSQNRMMDRPETSHPYYWSGFAIIGDAAKPLSGAPGR